MFKAISTLGSSLFREFNKPLSLNKQTCGFFSSWISSSRALVQLAAPHNSLSNSMPKNLLQTTSNSLSLSRNVTKFSLKTGKKKSVYPVLSRFYRLHNGLWIHRIPGCKKKIYRKNCFQKYKTTQHVICTRAQCIMFDQMITDHHKKRKYFIDDPFEPYHDRNNLDWVLPRRKWVQPKLPADPFAKYQTK